MEVNKKELKEQEIRTLFITPALERKGWAVSVNMREEYYFTDGRVVLAIFLYVSTILYCSCNGGIGMKYFCKRTIVNVATVVPCDSCLYCPLKKGDSITIFRYSAQSPYLLAKQSTLPSL